MPKNNIKIIFCFLIFITLSLLALFFLPLWRQPTATYLLLRNNFHFYGLTVLGLLFATFIYLWASNKLPKDSLKLKVILGSLAVLSLILILVFPIGASDIFLYLFQARTFAIHGLSPYLHTYNQLTNDAFYPILKDNTWAGHTSSYGPLFILLISGLSLIFKSNFLASIILLKIFFAILHLANTYLLSKTFSKKLAILYAFNPLIIFEFLINGHNEVLMIFFCLVSFYFLWAKTPNLKNGLLSINFLALGALVKFVPLLLLPIWGLALLWRLNNKNDKALFVGISTLSITTIIFLTYLPFGQIFSTILNPVINQMKFSNHLLVSPLIILLQEVFTGLSWTMTILISQAMFLCFLILIGFKITLERKKKDIKKLLNYGTLILLFFYASFFSWLMPWYFTFLLLLLLISYHLNRQKVYLTAFYAITLLGIIYYLILR